MYTKYGVIWTYGEKVMRQEMLYKINQRVIIQKRNKVELRFLCTAIRIIARNMHTKYGVIWTYGEKVMLRTRNAI